MSMIEVSGSGSSSERSFRGALATAPDMGLGLWSQKRFRAYKEFAANTVLKFVATKAFVLTSQRLWTGQGAARCVISTGGTEGGTFTDLPSKFCLNTRDGVANGFTTITQGGTVTIGTEREVLRADSGTAGGGSGNADLLSSPRVLAAGTYYMTITVTGTTSGMYALEWEELDA